MSKIQSTYNGSGRLLLESERPTIDAFNAKYRAALTESQSGKPTESSPTAKRIRRSVLGKKTVGVKPEGVVVMEAKTTKLFRRARARKAAKAVKISSSFALRKTKTV